MATAFPLHVRGSFLILAFLLMLTLSGWGPPVLTDGQYPPLRLYPDQIAQMAAVRQAPSITAPSALLVDLDANQALFELRPHEARRPASTAKLMTALLVLARGRLEDQVTVSANAAATEGSRMGLQAGEKLTVQDLLYGLLLPSGNDAAVALAEHLSGSEAAFVEQMNQSAAALGLEGTHFANSHGNDAPGQTTTAADLAKMARAALKYPLFATVVATQKAQVAGHDLVNTNQLLGTFPGADGVKTGTTDLAGECLVASVSRDGHRLLLVLLGSTDRYGDARELYRWANANWQWRRVILPDDALAWASGPQEQSYRLQAQRAPDVFLPAWEWPLAQPVRSITPTAVLTGTAPVGTLRLVLGQQVLAETPLVPWPGQ